MRLLLSLFWISLNLLILTSCGTSKLNVDFMMPSARFQTPETSGERWHGKANIGALTAHRVSLARSSQQKFVFGSVGDVTIEREIKLETYPTLGANANMGLAKRVDLIFRKTIEGTYNGGFQFQFLGEPVSKRETGWKMSIASTYGYQEEKEFSDSVSMGDTSGDFENVTARTVLNAWEVAMIMGYRESKNLMVYINTFYEQYNIDSRYGIKGGSNYVLDTDADNMGALLGFHVFVSEPEKQFPVFFQIEGGYSVAKVRGAATHDHASAATTIGANW